MQDGGLISEEDHRHIASMSQVTSISFSASGTGCAAAAGRFVWSCALTTCKRKACLVLTHARDGFLCCGMQHVVQCPNVCNKAGTRCTIALNI